MVKKLSNAVGELTMERVASLLADRVADRVVKALMDAGFDQQFAHKLLLALKEEREEERPFKNVVAQFIGQLCLMNQATTKFGVNGF